MKRLLFVAAALVCACVFAVPVYSQNAVTASLPNYAGATLTATDLTNSSHSATATIAANGGIALTLYAGDLYTFSVGAISSTYPAFTTGRTQIAATAYRSSIDISQALQAGAASVYVAPAVAAGTITPGTCPGPLLSNGIKPDGTVNCVTPTATLPPNSNAQLGTLTTAQTNSTITADTLATGAGDNALANAITNYATGAQIMVSPAYGLTEVSHYLTPAIQSVAADLGALYPVSGGIVGSWYAEDQRGRNRLVEIINPSQIGLLGDYNARSPLAWQARFSRSVGYADVLGTGILSLRVASGTDNYILPFASQKSNFSTLTLDAEVRAPAQGGGQIDSTLLHTAPGDAMAITIKHLTDGCSENEDECDKLFRAFIETMTSRWGGTLNATPTQDAAGFGNYALDVMIGSGYDARYSGEGKPLVNLQRPYTAGNVTGMYTSAKTGMGLFTADAAANWPTQFGTSTFTTLTSAVDGTAYSGCTQTSTAKVYPDPMITNESGVGGLTARCVAVGSTAGMAAGSVVRIMGVHGNFEDVKVVAVVDGTHFTGNFQRYHDVGENVAFGGMAQKGICMVADDIAPNGIPNYSTQNPVTLQKCFPVLGNDSTGAYVYLDASKAAEVSTRAYVKTTPNALATVGGVTMSGTGVQSVNLSAAGDYRTSGSGASQGQTLLAVPTVTFSGGSCATQPAAHGYYTATPTVAYTQQLAIQIDTPGNCSGTPTATLSTAWANPYRVVETAFTRKVINPATGSVNDGHLLVSALNPSNWQAGDLVVIPGWNHDFAANTRVFGKYYTAQSSNFGVSDQTFYEGTWASPDTLAGRINATDGHAYWTDATHPVGPGVGYIQPPNGDALGGNLADAYVLYLPPTKAIFTQGCVTTVQGKYTYNPCETGAIMGYDFWNNTDLGTPAHPHHLHYDGADTLSFDGIFSALTAAITNVFSAGSAMLGQAQIGDGNHGAYAPGSTDAIIAAGNTTTLNGYLGAMLGLAFCNSGQIPTPAAPCALVGGVQGALDFNRSFYSAVDTVVVPHNTGTLASRISVSRAWEDGMWALLGTNPCTNFEMFCDGGSNNWGVDTSGNWRQKTLKLTTATPSCSSTAGGTFNYIAGAAGTKDTVQVCAKDATNAYAWRTIY